MTVIIPPGYAQVVLNYSSETFDSGKAATLLGFGAALGPNPTSYETFAGVVADAWIANMQPSTDASITLSDVTVNGALSGATYAIEASGTGSWDSPPPNTTVLTTYRTGRRGPRGRGRSYWPGMVAEAWVSESGIIQASFLDDILGAVAGFLQDCKTGADPDVEHVILQGTSSDPLKPDKTPPITPPPIVNSVSLSNKVATQRRRLRR